MPKFAIMRDGELVKRVIFIGEGLYRRIDIQILTFDTEQQARELLTVWKKATIVDYTD
jgi:hypothetical protein